MIPVLKVTLQEQVGKRFSALRVCCDDTDLLGTYSFHQGLDHPGFLEVSYNPLQPSQLIEQGPGVLLRVFPPLFRQQGLTNDLKGLEVRFWPGADLSPGTEPGIQPRSPRVLLWVCSWNETFCFLCTISSKWRLRSEHLHFKWPKF